MIDVIGMEIPTITPQDISQFHSLHGEFKRLNEQASAAIIAARGNSENEITIARDGKAITVKEKDLWDEVFNLGPDCEGGKILAEKYPDAFTISTQAETKKKEFQALAMSKWNIDPLAMSLSDIMRITEAVVDYKLAQKA